MVLQFKLFMHCIVTLHEFHTDFYTCVSIHQIIPSQQVFRSSLIVLANFLRLSLILVVFCWFFGGFFFECVIFMIFPIILNSESRINTNNVRAQTGVILVI